MRPVHTPLLRAGRLLVKNESTQPGGSYKMRGVARLLAGAAVGAGASGGFSTVSAGNLGRALAIATRELGIPCTVYLPDSAPEIKKKKIASLGACVVELPFAKIWELLREPPTHPGFVHPINAALLEGYGTISDEIAAELPEEGAVVVPFGLGGLALGVAERMRILRPKIRIYAAELDSCAPLAAALEAGRCVRVEGARTFVDAIGTPEVLPFVFPRARVLLAGSVRVTLAETRQALAELERSHGIFEGAAAAAFAAAKKVPGENVVAVLTGANIDPMIHARECAGIPAF